MRKVCILIILGLCFLSTAAQAGKVSAMANITFHGTSTLHPFSGTVASQPFDAQFQKDAENGLIKVSARASVNVGDMTTENGKRDRNMFKMLDRENFDLITGALDAAIPREENAAAALQLKIRDVEQEVTATFSNWEENGDQMACQISFPVSLEAFGLQPPSVLGIIRVGDIVNVTCTVQGTIE